MSRTKTQILRLFLHLLYDIGILAPVRCFMGAGQRVRVTEYGGRQVVRRVVKDCGTFVVVCNEHEYATAKKNGREPEGIGFPRRSVEEFDANASLVER
jgi:hypothetical protein